MLFLDVFVVACSSIGKAMLVIFAGVLLTRRGALTADVRRGLSKMSASLLVPCLLLERLSRTVTPALLTEAWPILLAGFFYVILGCGLGCAVVHVFSVPAELRRPTIAAISFANSQALPIILIDVIAPALFDEGAAALGVAYIGLYLAVYLVLQWTIGAALLDVPMLTIGGGERSDTAASAASAATHEAASGTHPTNPASVEATEEMSAKAVALEEEAQETEATEAGRRLARRAMAGTATLLTEGESRWPGLLRLAPRAMAAVGRRVASPPIYGIAVGLAIGLLRPLRWLLVGGGETLPPLGFVMQAARVVGDAAIPVNTMLLGASLAKGPDWSAVPARVVGAVVVCKLGVMPAAALAVGRMLASTAPALPPLLLLVAMMEGAMPSANNLMMMCELAGGKSSKMMATSIFAQYLAAPVLLTAALTGFMALVQAQQALPLTQDPRPSDALPRGL